MEMNIGELRKAIALLPADFPIEIASPDIAIRALNLQVESFYTTCDNVLKIRVIPCPEQAKSQSAPPISLDKVRSLEPGLYKIFWSDNTHSKASIGRYPGGTVWYAPTNWTHVPSSDWSRVIDVQRLDL